MQTRWQDDVKGDPFLWLLEETNPSARYLTLRDLFDCADCDSQAADAREAIPGWAPVVEILSSMDPVDFWGRAERPFYGGAVGTAAILSLLADLGHPCTPQLEAACENLFEHGQHEDGGFTYDGSPSRIFLCYTGNAIRTLIHFGYADDPRLQRGLDYLVERATSFEGLTCSYADGEACQWGIVKVLTAFAALPASRRTDDHIRAVKALANGVLDHTFDLDGRDSRWLDFGFPLDYQSELTELCCGLACLGYGTDPRLQGLLAIVRDAQSSEGRWVKRYGTRALQVEKKGEPSKWVTIRALHAIKCVHDTVTEAALSEMRQSLFDT
jgi:hypothetical protein